MKQLKSSFVGRFSVYLILVLSMMPFLTACGTVDIDLTVFTKNRYELTAILSVPRDLLESSGGAIEIETQLNQLMLDETARGNQMSWKQLKSELDNVQQYEIHYEIANIYGSDIKYQEIRYQNHKAYWFEFPLDDLYSFESISLTLHAGRIYESNGIRVDRNTARWINPSEPPNAIILPKNNIKWLPLLGAILILLSVLLSIFIMYKSGRLKTWSSSGISAGKWKVQVIKLNNDQTQLYNKINRVHQELGKKAWDLKISHPDYFDTFSQLERLEKQLNDIQNQIQEIEQQLKPLRENRSNVESNFNDHINVLRENKDKASIHIKQIITEKNVDEKGLTRILDEDKEINRELISLQQRIEAAQVSTAPDKSDQINRLSNAVRALESKHIQFTNEIPRLQSEITRLASEQNPIRENIQNIDQQISQLNEEKNTIINPIDNQIQELQLKVKNYNEQKSSLESEMRPYVKSLGPQVDRARPESALLMDLYNQLDPLKNEMDKVVQQRDLLKTRISIIDSSAVKYFYIGIGILIVAAVFFIILLYLGFSP